MLSNTSVRTCAYSMIVNEQGKDTGFIIGPGLPQIFILVDTGRNLGRPSIPMPLLKTGSAKAGCSGCVPSGLYYL